MQWITDFSALVQGGEVIGGVVVNRGETTEEFVVPADEYFTRCPVSKEVFETVWDEDEGDYSLSLSLAHKNVLSLSPFLSLSLPHSLPHYFPLFLSGAFMYRNAVKVLVTQAADAALYKLALPTDQDSVQYLIVHKILVLDGWLQSGRAETLRGNPNLNLNPNLNPNLDFTLTLTLILTLILTLSLNPRGFSKI
jgi:hypothetical protein